MSKNKKKKRNNHQVNKKLTAEEQRKQDAFKTWRFMITFGVLFTGIMLLIIFGPQM